MVCCLCDYVLFFHYQLFLSGGVSYPVSEIVSNLNVYYKYCTYCNDVWDIVKIPFGGNTRDHALHMETLIAIRFARLCVK